MLTQYVSAAGGSRDHRQTLLFFKCQFAAFYWKKSCYNENIASWFYFIYFCSQAVPLFIGAQPPVIVPYVEMETDSGPVKPTVWVIIPPNTSVWKPHHSLRSGERSFSLQTRGRRFIDAPAEINSWITERWKKIQSVHCPNGSNTQQQVSDAPLQKEKMRRKEAWRWCSESWAKTPAVASLPLSTHVCTYAGPPTCAVGACCKTTAACFAASEARSSECNSPTWYNHAVIRCTHRIVSHTKVGQPECCSSSVAWQHLSSSNL